MWDFEDNQDVGSEARKELKQHEKNVRTGLESADPQLLEMARVFRLPLGRRVPVTRA